MSIEHVQAFIDASKLPENKDAYAAKLKSFGDVDGEESLVKLANQLGFEFDLEDLITFMANEAQATVDRIDSGELSEGQLDAVVGGSACSVWFHWPCSS